jgi:hypothetical protein
MVRKKRYIKKRCGFSKKLVYGLIGFLLILLMHLAQSSFFYKSNDQNAKFSGFKAGIVDHLSLTRPNQTFIETATTILKQAGYNVDYYSGEEVTVEFYRNLPTHGYKIIILRVHSTATLRSGTTQYVETSVSLFTSEPVSTTKYIYEQLTGRLVRVFYLPFHEGNPSYFGITSNFVRDCMNGRFDDAIIIMMGCDGLRNVEMAKAFIDKGAKVYIGWNGPVLASHTDYATIRLLEHLLIQKQTINQALLETHLEAGVDPAHKSLLIYYPPEAKDQTIENRS